MGRSSRSITATKIIAVWACLWAGPPALANPTIEIVERPYNVDATTIAGLRRQMSTRGPVGYWAYTRGHVVWRGHCEVTVRVRYSLPQHTRPEAMPADVRAKWDRMLKAMRAHEEQHGQHSINAGREIKAAGCRNGLAILRKWRAQDRAYDARTGHGKTEGVDLR